MIQTQPKTWTNRITTVAPAARREPTAERMLKDMAFVLQMTRRVKESISADRADAGR